MLPINRVQNFSPHTERRIPRLRLSESVQVLWGKREFHCILRNINAEGALLSGQFAAKEGDRIRMIFKPDDLADEMCLMAKVIDVKGTVISQLRVIFEDLPTQSKVTLRDYVIKHMPERIGRKSLVLQP